MTLPKFNNSFTVGNVITIGLVFIAALTAVLQAIEHQKNTVVHVDRSKVIQRDEFLELRREMNAGFSELKDQEFRHFELLTERIDSIRDR
jgi:hypothetical protein